jgi:hypothetical protein
MQLEHETLDAEEVYKVIAGETLPPVADKLTHSRASNGGVVEPIDPVKATAPASTSSSTGSRKRRPSGGNKLPLPVPAPEVANGAASALTASDSDVAIRSGANYVKS